MDPHLHRRTPADTELCQAIAVLARGQQDAIWRRTKAGNELRSFLREYSSTFLAAFRGRFQIGIASPEARAVLAIAPTPAAAVKLSVSRTAAALRRAGRQRGVDQVAAEIKAALRAPQLRQLPLVETAMGRQTLAILAALDAACHSVVEFGQAAGELFQTHPDYQIITSFPGLADSAGARVLAEIGDKMRFADARALKAYAGNTPITRASGRSISITRRRIKNDRPFSRQICLRQIRGGPAQDLVFLLQQLDPPPRIPQLSRLTGALAGLGALIDISLAHPLVQGHRVHTEIRGDLLDRHAIIAVAGDPHDVVAELTGVRPRHTDILPAHPSRASQLR
ncbi:transposase [Mycolicibacterium sp. Y3]